ncbi:HNH endonuclease signature motif containing protein [Salinibacterium sp. ZJ454]|uniref:HNH endonuclease signature motif containing protein n=1 Tax=Salinibacterium sp. ZJ454 TaxID=2708339 RepID=UPI00141D7925|nr:HNH endonuclease signature motif containing protein [Salinibacterium sp. ZJ454]
MAETADLLQQATSLLSDAVRLPVSPLSDDDLMHVTMLAEQAGRFTDALRTIAAAEVTERSRFELGDTGLARRLGHAYPRHLLEQVTRASGVQIQERVRLGAKLAPRVSADGQPMPPLYPAVSAAVIAGEVGVAAAAKITATLDQAAERCAPGDVATSEQHLVTEATVWSADAVAGQARLWRDALDPDGAAPREDTAVHKRSLTISREVDGLATMVAKLPAAMLAEIRAIFSVYASPKITPRFLNPEEADASDPATDPRTAAQRNADILLGLLRVGAAADPNRPRSRPVVVATVTLQELADGVGVGYLDDVDEPVSAATIDQLVCTGDLRLMVLGKQGEALWLSKPTRLFTDRQKLALAVRDGGCVNCGAPPSWTDAHHVTEHRNHGPTDIDNGVLLCPPCHRLLHKGAFDLKMVDGVPYLRAAAYIDPDRTWRRVGGARVNLRKGLSA